MIIKFENTKGETDKMKKILDKQKKTIYVKRITVASFNRLTALGYRVLIK